MNSTSEESSLTCENNALKGHLHYVNIHSFILYLSLIHEAVHNAHIVTNPLAFSKRAPSLYFERIFQKQFHLMRHDEKQAFTLAILSQNKLLQFYLFLTSNFCAFENFESHMT